MSSYNQGKHRKLKGNILISAVTVVLGCAVIASSILLLKMTPAAKPVLNAAAHRTSSAVSCEVASETSSQGDLQTSSKTIATSSASLVSLDSALFIGDAFTDGLKIYGGIDSLNTICENSMSAYSAYSRKYAIDGKSQKVTDVAAVKNPDAIYILLGSNDISQGYSVTKFTKYYGKLIESLKSGCPNAKIYVQSILPVTASYDKKQRALNNEKIEKFNIALSTLCSQEDAVYVDVASALKDADGCLPSDASGDGIHLKKAYYAKWVSFLESNG